MKNSLVPAETKNPLKSKTIWTNVVIALLAFVPSVAAHVTADQVMLIMGVVNVVLRLVSKDKIGLD